LGKSSQSLLLCLLRLLYYSLGDGGVIVAAPMPMPIEFNSPLQQREVLRLESWRRGKREVGEKKLPCKAVACFEIVMHLVLLISCKKN
jgi:hypothetical protein